MVERTGIIGEGGDHIAADALEKRLINTAKIHGIKPKSIKELIKKNELKKENGKKKTTEFEKYSVKEEGVYFHPAGGGDPVRISSPIYPEAYLRDSDGKTHSLLLRVFDGEINHYWAMSRTIITDWRELSRTFLDLGLFIPISPQNQKHLQTFLMLARPEKTLRCVDKSGWHGKQYVFPDGTVMGKEIDGESVYPMNQVCPEGIKQRGTLKEWQDNVVSICRNNSRMIFSLGISFSGPCLELANEDSGGFNLKGNSSIGKSRCLKIAASV